jgi:hypothetical protein
MKPQKLSFATTPAPLLNDPTKGDMGNAGPIVTSPIHLRGLGGTVQYRWPATASPVGTISFEVSNDHDPLGAEGNGSWEPVDASLFDPALVHPTGAAGNHMAELPKGAAYGRLKYSRSSGGASAALEAFFQGEAV